MLKVYVSSLSRKSGKTVVVAGLAATMQSLSYSVGVFKPVQTGSIVLNGFKTSADLAFVKNLDSNIITSSSYLLSGNSAPFVSSYQDGITININNIFDEYKNIVKVTDCSIIEGSNSISTPITSEYVESDLIKAMDSAMILVVNPKKNNIDEVIKGVKYLRHENINCKGLIITQYDENTDDYEEKYYPQIIKEFCNINILGILPDYGDISVLSAQDLIADILNKLNIEEIFGLEIVKLK